MLKKLFNADAIFASIILLISSLFFINSFNFTRETIAGMVNEGFFPRLLSIFVALMALYVIWDSARKNVKYFEIKEEQKDALKPILIIVGIFVIYILSWSYVHFIIKTLILLFAMCKLLKFKLLFSILYSSGFTLGIYLLFTHAFNILL